jgi:hypothetical protein
MNYLEQKLTGARALDKIFYRAWEVATGKSIELPSTLRISHLTTGDLSHYQLREVRFQHNGIKESSPIDVYIRRERTEPDWTYSFAGFTQPVEVGK